MGEVNWLNTSFIQKVLREADNDESIEVSSIIVKPAIVEGNNFMCDVRRLSSKISRNHNGNEIMESRSLIVKLAPQAGPTKETILEAGLFETEASMMFHTLPKINETLVKLGVSSFSARCLDFQHDREPIYIIIEDLAIEEYQMPTSQTGLDLDHCLLAIRKLAVFHASSVKLVEEDPNSMRKYNKGMYHKDYPPSAGAYINLCIKALGEEVANWTELSPRISEKILKLSENAYEKGCESASFRNDDFNVLTHGDFAAKNMMFRYDAQRKPIDVKFVDFQLSYYGSPATDVLFFLSTSPSDDVRINNRPLLLQEYHNSLASTMAKLNCNTKPPRFDTLEGILAQRAFCEVIPSFVMLQNSICDKSELKNFKELMAAGGKFEIPAHKGKLYRKIMTRALPLWDSMGLLDV